MGNKKCSNSCECDGLKTCKKGFCNGVARFWFYIFFSFFYKHMYE